MAPAHVRFGSKTDILRCIKNWFSDGHRFAVLNVRPEYTLEGTGHHGHVAGHHNSRMLFRGQWSVLEGLQLERPRILPRN